MTSLLPQPGTDVVAFILRPTAARGMSGSVAVRYESVDLPLRHDDNSTDHFAWHSSFLPEIDRFSVALLNRLGFTDTQQAALVPHVSEFLGDVDRGTSELRAQPLRQQLAAIETGEAFYIESANIVVDLDQNPRVNLGMCV